MLELGFEELTSFPWRLFLLPVIADVVAWPLLYAP
jgi:hypothetical protein